MTVRSQQAHWDRVYGSKGEAGVSWFEDHPETSLSLLAAIGATPNSAIIDIGGGDSHLVDALLAAHWKRVTVLDLSPVALGLARARLGEASEGVQWIAADLTEWEPSDTYDIWHDRAVFHFLVDAHDRSAYADRLRRAVRPGGHAIIATFAPDGPDRCSGLPVMRYDPETLAGELGARFSLVASRSRRHVTPWGAGQAFQFSVLRSG
jgi:trans-aconitate methyltransferase